MVQAASCSMGGVAADRGGRASAALHVFFDGEVIATHACATTIGVIRAVVRLSLTNFGGDFSQT